MNNKINKKRIGIDARFYGPLGKGLGRYTKEVVDRLVLSEPKYDYIIFLSRDNFTEFKINSANVKKVLADVRWYTLAEQIVMPYLIKKEKLDLMHFPHFNVPLYCPVDFIVTIHDLILTKYPTIKASTLGPILYWFKNLAYRLVISRAVHKAKKLIAVSQFTKNDLIKQFNLAAEKIVVTHLGVANAFNHEGKNNAAAVLAKYGITEKFLLYVGNAYPHKNLEGLINVFIKLQAQESSLQLVLVGKDDYFYERVKQYAVAKGFNQDNQKIIFPGFVTDHDLVYFYRQAQAYVFPSFYEGFGLPPLEAMAQDCPVASSNQASMPEILGDAAIYFDPNNEGEMINQIIRLINNKTLRNELIAKGRIKARSYDWQKCAEKTSAVYSEIIK